MRVEDLIETINEFARHNKLNRKNPFKKRKIGKGISVSFIRIEGEDGGLRETLRIFSSDLRDEVILQVVVDDGTSNWLMKKSPNEECHSVTMCLGKGSHIWYVRKYTRSIHHPNSSKDLESETTLSKNT